jgi:thiamine biosynthesis lipoprotein
MATTVSVDVPQEHAGAIEEVFAVFRDVEESLSEWREDSPLAAVNDAAGDDAVVVPPLVLAAVQRSLAIADLTGGAFDPTWAALWCLWDFKASHPTVPTADEIAERLPLVDWQLVDVDPAAMSIRLPRSGMVMGLGGIAKGIAMDHAVLVLDARGIDSFMITAGGQVFVRGLKDGRQWQVGVQEPGGGRVDLIMTLELTDTCVSTSGDSEQFFEVDGTRYHHVLDPRTGIPSHGVRSVTVISPDATLADALSTALMVMGTDRGLQLVRNLPSVDALLIDDTGTIHSTMPGDESPYFDK